MYRFIDNKGTFTVKNPLAHQLYFPLTNQSGSLLASISPNLAGDLKHDDNSFITPPASIEDIRSNLLCRRDLFIRLDNNSILRLSEGPYTEVECGFLYHKLRKNCGPLAVEILNFIPYDLDVEIMLIRLKNKSGKTLTITPTSFMPLYGRTSANVRDHRHVSSLLNRLSLDNFALFLKPTMIFNESDHTLNKTTYYSLAWEGKGRPPLGQFPTLDAFCGTGDLIHPQAIEEALKPLTRHCREIDGKEAAAAFRFKTKKLLPQTGADYCLITGFHKDPNNKKAFEILKKLNSLEKVKASLEATKNYWQGYLSSSLEYNFNDREMDNWLRWVKFQPTLRKLFGCSFLPHFDYGKSGRGWRDLWQDSLTLLISEPRSAAKSLIDNFKGVRVDGSNATIIAKDNTFLSDRDNINRVWMDHGIWPYITTRFYIHKTGDIAILKKNIPYFQDHLFGRGTTIDKNNFYPDLILRTKNKTIYRGSVLEHILLELLTPFFNVGGHNIPRLENADWNDGLDMAADKGESACFGTMYAHHLNDITLLLEKLRETDATVTLLKEIKLLLDSLFTPVNYDEPKAKQERLKSYYNAVKTLSGETVEITIDSLIADLKKKSGHLVSWLRGREFLKTGFYNGYYDNKGRRVEGKKNDKVVMFLASQVFAIMSGVAGDEQVKQIWKAIKKYLQSPGHKGFRLNTDLKKPYPELGRAFGFSYGDKENGAFFSHMIIMLAHALYKRNFKKEAFEAFNSLYIMSSQKAAKIYPQIPEYFNSQGRGLYLYLTGSASWYIYTLTEEVLGIKSYYGDIVLEPKLNRRQFKKTSISAAFNNYGKILNLQYIRPKKMPKELSLKKVMINGLPLKGQNGRFLIKKSQVTRCKSKSIQIKAYF
jgi:cellobiose phosphorylase